MFFDLPYELIILIALFCNAKQVGRLALTCRKFSQLLQEKKYNFYGSITQMKAMFCIKRGENVFLHGPGGCGKSFTLDLIYDYGIQMKKNIKFCSMFGRAASNLKEGYTICSLVGTAKLNRKDWFKDNNKRLNRAAKVFRELNILVIDEISTCGKTVLENLNQIAQHAKRNNQFMGGIQVIISGDLFQLEPVGDLPCWKSELFNEAAFTRIEYEYSFRQKELLFSNMLHRVRKGKQTPKDIQLLQSRMKDGNHIPATAYFIFGDNKRADRMNKACLQLIDSPSVFLHSEFEFIDKSIVGINTFDTYPAFSYNELFNKVQDVYGHVHPETLEVKDGARILLTKNISVKDGFCNGSQGTLSIVEKPEGTEYYFIGLKKKGEKRKKLLLTPMQFYIFITPRYYGIRIGFPIRLGYSGTVHSTQGITLNEVAICLDKKINRKGQAYTAMSRVTDMKNLYFSAFDTNYIRTNYNDLTQYN